MKIAILGAGRFGTALGGLLAERGYDLDYYDPKKEKESLKNVVTGAGMILVTMPSETVSHILVYLPKDLPLIIASKGFLTERIFDEFSKVTVLSGSGFAEEIKERKSAGWTVTDREIEGLFGAEWIDFDFTDDARGVLLCGALKNVYAIGAGLRDLREGTEEYRRYLVAVLAEMERILEANGARGETVDLHCGKDDLALTCQPPSRNYEFGDRWRKNTDYCPTETVEGVTALKRIRRGEIKVPKEAEILRELVEISENWDF